MWVLESLVSWKTLQLFAILHAFFADSDYRGNIGVILFNFSDKDFEVKAGDRIAQLILERIAFADVEEVQDLQASERGAGGFGSTGVQSSTDKKPRTE